MSATFFEIKKLSKPDSNVWRYFKVSVEQAWVGIFCLQTHTYATSSRWEEHSAVWNKMKEENIKKTPGATWVYVNGKAHMFYVDAEFSYL